jgi:Flp pilus assembly protein TadG
MSARRFLRRRQGGVSMVEFTLVAPLFFLLLMVLADFSKAVYDKNTLDAAAREGVRRAILVNSPTTSDVLATITQHSSALSIPTSGCVFDTSHAAPSTANTGYIYLSAPPGGGNGSYSTTGKTNADGTPCTTPSSAGNHSSITVTIVYRYSPLTPLLSQVVGDHITFTSTSTFTTDY